MNKKNILTAIFELIFVLVMVMFIIAFFYYKGFENIRFLVSMLLLGIGLIPLVLTDSVLRFNHKVLLDPKTHRGNFFRLIFTLVFLLIIYSNIYFILFEENNIKEAFLGILFSGVILIIFLELLKKLIKYLQLIRILIISCCIVLFVIGSVYLYFEIFYGLLFAGLYGYYFLKVITNPNSDIILDSGLKIRKIFLPPEKK